MLDKLREVFLLKHEVKEKYVVVHLLEVVETLESNLSLKKNKGLKLIKAVHCASLPREFERQDMKSIFKKKLTLQFYSSVQWKFTC